MKINDLLLWEAYLAVAKQGNFAKAAQALKTPVSQISKRVSRLEELLGVRLFARSTRVVKLTDEGRAMLDRATTLLEDFQNLERSFEDQQEIAGTLRITSAPHIGNRFIAPILAEYRARHPRVQIEIELSESFQDLIQSQFDVALRVDEPEDTNLIYLKIFANEIGVYASPEYLRTMKEPLKAPKDLERHSVLMYSALASCRFIKSGVSLQEMNLRREIRSDNGAFIVDLARRGMGVLIRSRWDVSEEVAKGLLVPVLERYPLENFGNAYVVIPSRKYLAPRVRAFVDLALEKAKEWNK